MVSSYTTSPMDHVFADWYIMVIHWTHNDQFLPFARHLIRLFAHAVHVGTYWRGFRTPATSKAEHFVTIAKAFSRKQEIDKKSAEKEKEHCVDKFPQINTVKTLHEYFILQSKTCYVNHAFFLFVVVFSNLCRRLLNLQTLHTVVLTG